MKELVYSSKLIYTIKHQCFEESEGWEALDPIKDSCSTFFKALGASVSFEELWEYDECAKFANTIVGYHVTVIFNGEGAEVYGFPMAAALFFNRNNFVKKEAELYLIEKMEN
ncbi:hypothetical protein [Pseudotamlana carrageenivorans]|nr:hypothetical protein [Tamlana carrageenivorans]